MCGRYVIEDFQELSETLRQIPFQTDYEWRPNWNAAPSQLLPVLVPRDDGLHLEEMHWGLVPAWLKPGEKPKVTPINARSETLAEKPMFRNLIKKNRCVVPMNGFYEWKKTGGPKQPYFIHRSDSPIMLMAGLYSFRKGENDEWQGSYTIVTGGPNETMAGIHDRMPTILEPDDVPLWIDPEITTLEPLEHLFQPVPDDEIAMYKVTKDVGNVQNNYPELIDEIASQTEML